MTLTLTLTIAALRRCHACDLDERIADLRRVLPDVRDDEPVPLATWWALPFAGMLDLPSRVFTGNITPLDAFYVVGHQLLWTGILVALGRWLLARGVRRIVVQGG